MNSAASGRSLVTSANGLQLQVIERGNCASRGILFIHGFGQSHLSFKRQFESNILSSYHLVAFDLRGHGGSDKPRAASTYQESTGWAQDVAAVLEATQLLKPTLVGWSYGGYVAADYVRHYGVSNIGALNLVGSSAGLNTSRSPSSEAAPRSPPPNDILDLSELVRLGRDAARQFDCPEMTNDERDLLFATEMMMPNYVRSPILTRDLNNADIRGKFEIPVLISCGSADGYLSVSTAEALAASLSFAKVSAYEGAGHLPFIQCSRRFDDELRELASHQ